MKAIFVIFAATIVFVIGNPTKPQQMVPKPQVQMGMPNRNPMDAQVLVHMPMGGSPQVATLQDTAATAAGMNSQDTMQMGQTRGSSLFNLSSYLTQGRPTTGSALTFVPLITLLSGFTG